MFCCFNANYKIEPFIFDVWMRILRQVPGSALWLLQLAPEVAGNLRREAAARGIDGDRLVFAGMRRKAEHLARHRLADLFLDTRYYTAHTTCSDALCAGLPVLTCMGNTLPAGGCQSPAGGRPPELIAPDFTQYEARAIALAQEPAMLGRLRARLDANRLTCPAFDTNRVVRNLERAYRLMWDTYRPQAAQPLAKRGRPVLTSGRQPPASLRGRALGAAYVLREGASDDGFEYFQRRLISRGAKWGRAAGCLEVAHWQKEQYFAILLTNLSISW